MNPPGNHVAAPMRPAPAGRALTRAAAALCLLGTLAALCMLAPAPARAAIGELIVLKGEVSLVRGNIHARVREPFDLEDGDRVVTAAGAKALIRLHGDMEGTQAVVTEKTDFQVAALLKRSEVSPIQLLFGAIRSRVRRFTDPRPFMTTPVAAIGIKGTDFIVYVKQQDASEFIGVEGLIRAASKSRPEYGIEIGKRQWGKIVEGEPPRPPIRVPDALWDPAMEEFRFPTPEELRAAERRGR